MQNINSEQKLFASIVSSLKVTNNLTFWNKERGMLVIYMSKAISAQPKN